MALGDFQVGECSVSKFQTSFPLEMMLQLSQLCHFEAGLSHQNVCKSPNCITPSQADASLIWPGSGVLRLTLFFDEVFPRLNHIVANELLKGFSFKSKSKNFCDLFLLEGRVSDKAVYMAALRLDTGFCNCCSIFCAIIFKKRLQSSYLWKTSWLMVEAFYFTPWLKKGLLCILKYFPV